MTDPVDEWAAGGVGTVEGKRLVSAMRADLQLSSVSSGDAPEEPIARLPLADRMQVALADKVREVRLSARLTDSPCCLVLAGASTPAYMEQLLRSSGRTVSRGKRILEINPQHPAVLALNAVAERTPDAPELAEWMELLYDQAVLMEGSPVEDPNRLSKQICKLLGRALELGGAEPQEDRS
jgi:molecular chaperone HtpG